MNNRWKGGGRNKGYHKELDNLESRNVGMKNRWKVDGRIGYLPTVPI